MHQAFYTWCGYVTSFAVSHLMNGKYTPYKMGHTSN